MIRDIKIEELQDYINSAFEGDDELLSFYDRNANVKTLEDCCNNTFQKIRFSYPNASYGGLDINVLNIGTEMKEKKIGFVVYENNMLISFGINKSHRDSDLLKLFWSDLKYLLGANFCCSLYSYNTRAIDWLKKCGMQVVYENITVLINQ